MKLIIYALLGALITSCAPASFKIIGQVDSNKKSTSVELREPNSKRENIIISVPVNEKSAFELTTEITPGKMYIFELRKDYIRIPVYAEKETYKLVKQDSQYYIISENENSLQNQYMTFLKEKEAREKTYSEWSNKYMAATDIHEKAKISETTSALFSENNEHLLAGVRKFAGTEIAQFIVDSFLHYCQVDHKFFVKAIEALGENVPDSDMKTRIFDEFEKSKARQLTGVAPEFQLPDQTGKEVKLSSFQGKYVLVDFWASWCAPCRKKNKELNKYYDELKALNIEVISVSMDDDKTKWLNAVKEDSIQWLQLVDLKGFKESTVRTAYKVEQVPTVYLIDPQGTVVMKNPTLEEIKNSVK